VNFILNVSPARTTTDVVSTMQLLSAGDAGDLLQDIATVNTGSNHSLFGLTPKPK